MHLDADRARGLFLTLEGPDGSGKSTQTRLLGARLEAAGVPHIVTREPGGTPVGEAVRQILLHARELSPVAQADALLFNAARAQQVAEVIRPALARGLVVVCDRFNDSTLAYQGYGSGMPLEDLRVLGRFATGGLVPDLTILIDLPVDVGLRRKTGEEITRFEERKDVEFHRRVRAGFLEMAAAEPGRWRIVDGRAAAEDVAAAIAAIAFERLGLPAPAPAGVVSGDGGAKSEPNRSSLRIDL
jgi:dTMP kinase